MKKLTTLYLALLVFALMAGTTAFAGTLGKELNDQLSPNAFGHVADGMSDEAYRGPIDRHYGVAPVWEGGTGKALTITEDVLSKQLSPNAFGYSADGVGDEEFRGVVDIHYGIAPAWEDKTEEPLEKALRKHLSPNAFENFPY